MFLFLSKLLPVFIYPLGVSCLLLIVALVLHWRNSSCTPIPIISALAIILIASNSWFTDALVWSLESQYIPKGELPTAEAIVLLGGTVKSADPPRPMVDVTEQGDRVLYAVKLYRQKKAPLIIASGGRISWLGGGTPEATDISQLLQFMGVPSEDILEDPTSLNTYENAVNVKAILNKHNIHQILLVTSALHMPRAMGIFRKQGIEAIAAPTDFLVTQSQPSSPSLIDILFNSLPDPGNINTTTQALKEYIGSVVYRFKG